MDEGDAELEADDIMVDVLLSMVKELISIKVLVTIEEVDDLVDEAVEINELPELDETAWLVDEFGELAALLVEVPDDPLADDVDEDELVAARFIEDDEDIVTELEEDIVKLDDRNELESETGPAIRRPAFVAPSYTKAPSDPLG